MSKNDQMSEGIEVSAVDRQHADFEKEALQKVGGVTMQDDPSILAGQRPLGAAALAAIEQNSEKNKKRKESNELSLVMVRLDEHLRELDRMIAALEAELAKLHEQRVKIIEDMDANFEGAHEIEDLISGIRDGNISPAEQRKIDALLGKKAEDRSPGEIVVLLTGLQKQMEKAGRDASEEVSDLDEEIAKKERQVEVINDLKAKGLEAQSEQNLGKTVSFNDDAEDYFAKLDVANSENNAEQQPELNAEVEAVADQSLIAEPEFGF